MYAANGIMHLTNDPVYTDASYNASTVELYLKNFADMGPAVTNYPDAFPAANVGACRALRCAKLPPACAPTPSLRVRPPGLTGVLLGSLLWNVVHERAAAPGNTPLHPTHGL